MEEPYPRTKQGKENLQPPEAQLEAEDKVDSPGRHQGRSQPSLPTPRRPRDDGPPPEKEAEMGGLGQMLVANQARQSRQHIFQDCKEWKKEIYTLQEGIGNISGDREGKRSEKDFGYDIRKSWARPSNTMIRCWGTKWFTDAVLAFLRDTKVGRVKEGILNTEKTGKRKEKEGKGRTKGEQPYPTKKNRKKPKP